MGTDGGCLKNNLENIKKVYLISSKKKLTPCKRERTRTRTRIKQKIQEKLKI